MFNYVHGYEQMNVFKRCEKMVSICSVGDLEWSLFTEIWSPST